MKTFFISLLSFLFISSLAFADSVKVFVNDPWVRLAPPNSKVFAAYFMLKNEDAKDYALVSASSPKFKTVELHLSKVENGVAMMEKLAQISLPAQKTVEFVPGGLHVMLIEPKEAINLGDKIPMTLTLGSGQTIETEAVVKKSNAPMKEHRGSGGHMKTN